MLRLGYYAACSRTSDELAIHHVNHCTEYLRQSIMCHADTNLEYREEIEPGQIGTTGYGEHQCRNFQEARDFAEKWRVWNGKTPAERTKISEEENIPGRVIHYEYISSRGDRRPVEYVADWGKAGSKRDPTSGASGGPFKADQTIAMQPRY